MKFLFSIHVGEHIGCVFSCFFEFVSSESSLRPGVEYEENVKVCSSIKNVFVF